MKRISRQVAVILLPALVLVTSMATAREVPDFVVEQEIIAGYSSTFAEANDNSSTLWACGELSTYAATKTCLYSVLENEGQYPGVWRSLAGLSKRHGRLRDSAAAYRKWIELRKRCVDGTTVHCFGTDASSLWHSYDWWELVDAGLIFVRVADYASAAKILRAAIDAYEKNPSDLVGEENRRRVGEWLAIARFGESDVETAWMEYKSLLSGYPFPGYNQQGLSADEARRLKSPPADFYAMLKGGMQTLSKWAYRDDHLFYEYAQAQNAARAEALLTKVTREKNLPIPYESEAARDRLIAILLDIKRTYSRDNVNFLAESRFTVEPSLSIHPVLSIYAVKASEEARKAIERRKYQEAEDQLRLALATDPWWSEARYQLARLEFINYGWCGPDETLDYIEELDARGIGATPADGPYFGPSTLHREVHWFQTELDQIWKEASESGSTRLEGWCDIEGAVPIRPGVEVQ